jgi:anti-anti-sigma factor
VESKGVCKSVFAIKEHEMAFGVTSEVKDQVAEVTLSGELDAGSAPELQEELTKILEGEIKQLVLNVKDLQFMASAGIRMLIFAKQKKGTDLDVYVIAPQDQIKDLLTRTGLLSSFIVQDEYSPEN